MLTSRLVELVFIASPEVASPPVVLPDTLALPLLAVCEVELVTLTLLLFVTVVFTLLLVLTTLLESGPVLVMVPDVLPMLGSTMAAALAPEPELSTLTVALRPVLFEAVPLIALPPVVLCQTLALPVLALCDVVLTAFTLLLFLSFVLTEL